MITLRTLRHDDRFVRFAVSRQRTRRRIRRWYLRCSSRWRPTRRRVSGLVLQSPHDRRGPRRDALACELRGRCHVLSDHSRSQSERRLQEPSPRCLRRGGRCRCPRFLVPLAAPARVTRRRPYATGEAFVADLEALSSEGTPVVLLDLRLPGMSGAQVQDELAFRAMRWPIIMLTAHGDASSARNALKSGASDFIEKPVEEAVLLSALETRICRTKRNRRGAHAAGGSEQPSRAAHRRASAKCSRWSSLVGTTARWRASSASARARSRSTRRGLWTSWAWTACPTSFASPSTWGKGIPYGESRTVFGDASTS